MPGQRVNRFDLGDRPPVRYLAESPEHAIGEVLAPFRGTAFDPSYLRFQRRPMALVEVTLAASLVARLADCTDPAVLQAWELRPDALAHHDRTVTQAIARRLHAAGEETGTPAGLRWWSALTGAWHTTVVFTDRERDGEVSFGVPAVVDVKSVALKAALLLLGMARGRGG